MEPQIKMDYHQSLIEELPLMKKWLKLLLCAVLFLSALALYESMAPKLLSSANYGSDGGDFLAAVLTKGIPHPTGYPLYLLLSMIVEKLFFNTAVWKQVQLSILPSALAVSLLFYITTFFQDKSAKYEGIIAGVLASVLLATAPLFWSQSVIVEVYTLNIFFIALAVIWFFLALKYSKKANHHIFPLILLAWVCGLGLGNHVTYVFIYPLVLIGLWNLIQSKANKWCIFLCAVGWLSGLFTYILLPIRAQHHPLVNWGDPETLSGFLWLLKGGGYSGNVFGIELQEYPARIISWISLLFAQFGIFGMLASIWGIIYAKVSSLLKWSTVYVFFVYSIFAIGYKTNDSLVYLLPSLLIFSLWISWGILTLWKTRWKKINLGLILSILIVINLIIVLPARYQANAPTTADLSQYAQETLAQAPNGAIVYPTTDGQTFALWYYQYGLGIRPDVKIISHGLLQYSWYRESLLHNYPKLTENDLQ
jgi:hypothetical protein